MREGVEAISGGSPGHGGRPPDLVVPPPSHGAPPSGAPLVVASNVWSGLVEEVREGAVAVSGESSGHGGRPAIFVVPPLSHGAPPSGAPLVDVEMEDVRRGEEAGPTHPQPHGLLPSRVGSLGGSHSWAGVVRGKAIRWVAPAKITEEEVRAFQKLDGIEVLLSGKILEEIGEPWKDSLVGKLLGRPLLSSIVGTALARQWRTQDKFFVTPLAEGFFVFRFDNGEDREKVRLGGPWLVGGQLLALEERRPFFRPSNSFPPLVAIWMRLPKLPMELWDKRTLLPIVSAAGLPIRLDACTESFEKRNFARVCVRVDMSKPLIPDVTIGREEGPEKEKFWQSFVYENVPVICFS